ncbi:hypothetical protein M5D96_008080, partial [Drosophila gunungcola]
MRQRNQLSVTIKCGQLSKEVFPLTRKMKNCQRFSFTTEINKKMQKM